MLMRTGTPLGDHFAASKVLTEVISSLTSLSYCRSPCSSRWKRCWFVLKDRVLYTYRASEDSVAIDTFPVLGWSKATLDDFASA